MRIATHYSHLNGLEYLLAHKPKVWEEIQAVVTDVDAEAARTKVSRDKTMRGKLLHFPDAMNVAFKDRFADRGWEGSRRDYWITESARLIRKTM